MDDKCICINEESVTGVLKTVYLFLAGQNLHQTCQAFLDETEGMGYAEVRKSTARVLVLKPSVTEVVKVSHAHPDKTELHVQTDSDIKNNSCLLNSCVENANCGKTSSKHVCVYYGEPLRNTISAPILNRSEITSKCPCTRNADCRQRITFVQTVDNSKNDRETKRFLRKVVEEEVKISKEPEPDLDELRRRAKTKESPIRSRTVTPSMVSSKISTKSSKRTQAVTLDPSQQSEFVRVVQPFVDEIDERSDFIYEIGTPSKHSSSRNESPKVVSPSKTSMCVSMIDTVVSGLPSTKSVVSSNVDDVVAQKSAEHPEVHEILEDINAIVEYKTSVQDEVELCNQHYTRESNPQSLTTLISKTIDTSKHSINSRPDTDLSDSSIKSNQTHPRSAPISEGTSLVKSVSSSSGLTGSDSRQNRKSSCIMQTSESKTLLESGPVIVPSTTSALVRFNMQGKIVDPVQSIEPSLSVKLDSSTNGRSETKPSNMTYVPNKSILRVDVDQLERNEPIDLEVNIVPSLSRVRSHNSLPDLSPPCLSSTILGGRQSFKDQCSGCVPDNSSRSTMTKQTMHCNAMSTASVESSCRCVIAKPISVTRALSAQTVESIQELDYNRLKKALRKGSPTKTTVILQALRWRLTSSSPEIRNDVITSYTRHDLLSLHGTPVNHRTLVEHFICRPITVASENSEDEESMARLVNAMASLTVGRDYLCQDETLLRKTIVPLVMGIHPNKQKLNHLTKEHLLVALQKFSLRNNMRLVMIQSGLAEYLVSYLPSVHNQISDYCLEYSLALFMNLCLHNESIQRLKKKPREVINFFSLFLSSSHDDCLSYINGAMYSLFMDPDIRKEGKHGHLDSKIREKSPYCDEEIRQQFEVILDILMANKQNFPCPDCECIDQDDEIDHLENELEMDDVIVVVPNGEDVLSLYYIHDQLEDSTVIPLTCVCRPVTPYKRISAYDRCPAQEFHTSAQTLVEVSEDLSAHMTSSLSQRHFSNDSFSKKQQKSCFGKCKNSCAKPPSASKTSHPAYLEESYDFGSGRCPNNDLCCDGKDNIPTKDNASVSQASAGSRPISRQLSHESSLSRSVQSSRVSSPSRPVSRSKRCETCVLCESDPATATIVSSVRSRQMSAPPSMNAISSRRSMKPSCATSCEMQPVLRQVRSAQHSTHSQVTINEQPSVVSCHEEPEPVRSMHCSSHQSLKESCVTQCGSKQNLNPCGSTGSKLSLMKEPCGQICGKKLSARSIGSVPVNRQRSIGAVSSRQSMKEGSSLTKQDSLMRSLKEDLAEIEEEKPACSSELNITARELPREESIIRATEAKEKVHSPPKKKPNVLPPKSYARSSIGKQNKHDYCYMPNTFMLTPCNAPSCMPQPSCMRSPCMTQAPCMQQAPCLPQSPCQTHSCVPPSACKTARLIATPCVPTFNYSYCYKEDPCNYYQPVRMLSRDPNPSTSQPSQRSDRYKCGCYDDIKEFSDSIGVTTEVNQTGKGCASSRRNYGSRKSFH